MTIHTINLWVCDIQTPACESPPLQDTYVPIPFERYAPERPEGWTDTQGGWVHLLMLVGIPTAFFALMGAGDGGNTALPFSSRQASLHPRN